MAKPVIFDDGGSLRIRAMDDNQTMDGLMDPPAAAVGTNETFAVPVTVANPTGFQCTLTVRYMDEYGLFTVVPFSGGLYGQPLNIGDIVTISSKKQSAVVTFPAKVLSIVLSNSANASQEGPRRRYVVPNFGKITNVSIGANIIFNGKDANGNNLKTSFVMVHFSDGAQTTQFTPLVQHKKEHRRHKGHAENQGD